MVAVIPMLKNILRRLKSEADFVIEQGEDYTKWNSGKIEQWGAGTFAASSGRATMQVYFPIEFPDTDYRFTATLNCNAVNTVRCIAECDGGANVKRTTKQTTVSCVKEGASYNIGFNWYAVRGGVIHYLMRSLGGGCHAISKGIYKKYAYAAEELKIHKIKQRVEAAWKHYRNLVLLAWQLHRDGSVRLLRGRSGRAKHSCVSTSCKWRNDAFSRLVQRCDICPDVENVCKGIEAATGIYGRTTDLRPIGIWGWSYA